jgi:hypothetical protein
MMRREFTGGIGAAWPFWTNGCSGSMLSRKGFLAAALDFAALPATPARANVRDHIESQEDDRGAPDRGLQQRRPLKTVFCEILGTAQFSASVTFRRRALRPSWKNLFEDRTPPSQNACKLFVGPARATKVPIAAAG